MTKGRLLTNYPRKSDQGSIQTDLTQRSVADSKCVTLRRMPIKKVAKTHTSSRKKASASSTTKRGTKKASAKASKRAAKPKLTKKQTEELAREKRLKKLMKLTLKVFQMAYEANQRGEFHRF